MNNTLYVRMNAEGLKFAAIKTAIHKAGESLKTKGFTYGPFKVALTNLPRYNSLYRGMVLDAAPAVQTWEEITSPFPEIAWVAVYEFHSLCMWMAMQNGAKFIVENDTTKWWCRKVDNEHIVIDKMYDSRHEQWEEEQYLFLPPGIRAATAALIGADFASSTFHTAFDAVVDGTAVY